MTAVLLPSVPCRLPDRPNEHDAWVSLAEHGFTIHAEYDDLRADDVELLASMHPERAELLYQRLVHRAPDYPGGRATLDIDDAIDVLRAPDGGPDYWVRGDVFAVHLALTRAQDAAARGLPAELKAPSQAALRGMVDVVLRAGPDRWQAMEWLAERLATHVLTKQPSCQLSQAAAVRILDGTLTALPSPGRDQRDGAARLWHGALRAYQRILGARADAVREHLTREWAETVDALAAEGCPLEQGVVLARRWLGELETAEAYA